MDGTVFIRFQKLKHSKREASERGKERKNEWKTANNSVHLSDWNQVVSSTGVECFEQRTQTDANTNTNTIPSIAVSISIAEREIFRVKQYAGGCVVLLFCFMHTRSFCHFERVTIHT